MRAVGHSCVPRERRPPRDEGERPHGRPDITPGDVIRVIPQVVPHGGDRGGPFEPRGGGRGGPSDPRGGGKSTW